MVGTDLRSVVPWALVASLGCASGEGLGVRSVSILGPGVVNDPENKSLRFDLLKFGLSRFCEQMQTSGAPLRMGDDEPVLGRFFASSCNSQVIDDPSRKSFVVQYAGEGFASSQHGGRVSFSTTGLVEYAPDFLMSGGALYVYFRPRVVDATGFQTLLVESQLASAAFAVFGATPDAFGRRVVEGQLRRGFTVIRIGETGETEFGLGYVPLGERPHKPFTVETQDKQILANERTEVHPGQQDFLGPFEVTSKGMALYVTLALDGAPAADAVLVDETSGRTMIQGVLRQPGAATPSSPPVLDEPVLRGELWKRYVAVPKGKYYLVLDNSDRAGRTAPPPGVTDGQSARIDALVMIGDRP